MVQKIGSCTLWFALIKSNFQYHRIEILEVRLSFFIYSNEKNIRDPPNQNLICSSDGSGTWIPNFGFLLIFVSSTTKKALWKFRKSSNTSKNLDKNCKKIFVVLLAFKNPFWYQIHHYNT